ncbi:MAG: outer membrane lipid asymmetry maintenance protein MlaD [Magnetococcales bacterium]|nr:outer membrane lipid asymmetry maintenance protein MlaD [Magnetococcales bacterium]
MRSAKLEISVGLFVIGGLLALGWLSVKLARMEMIGSDNIPLYAQFTSISGLKSGAPVEIAGVEVGRVSEIFLDKQDFEAKVQMKIRPDVPIQQDAIASIRTKGLIGERYIAISPGSSDTILKADESIVETEPAINFEELISQFVHGAIE